MRDNTEEIPILFDLDGDRVLGIFHRPQNGLPTGILIITGGPQYRVGSHRQFVLIARHLADNGIPVMRFDYRGMGDSSGVPRKFNEAADDIRAAIDTFFKQQPELRQVVLWGLCDAASAAMMYAHQDERVTGIVALNPWVRTESGAAKTLITNYYGDRLVSADFWTKIWRGQFRPYAAVRSLIHNLRRAAIEPEKEIGEQSYIESMRNGLLNFDGQMLLIVSGDDLTAAEFLALVSRSDSWQRVMASDKVTRKDLADANHTFSKAEWRARVQTWTREWTRRL